MANDRALEIDKTSEKLALHAPDGAGGQLSSRRCVILQYPAQIHEAHMGVLVHRVAEDSFTQGRHVACYG